ncbi:MAG: type II toxin-antitoxin system VapC family toxin [Candidatus Kapabacteria bacterium]|nr:type II toxin-antitoxin system VapC family toxin [Candidatus Kapabacteria bacterium]
MTPPYVMDSSAWLEFYRGNKEVYTLVIDQLRKREIIVPSICIYEVALAIERSVGEDLVKVAVANMREQKVDDLTATSAVALAHFRSERSLAMADAIVYASTLAHNATLITFDTDFKGLPNVHYIKQLAH